VIFEQVPLLLRREFAIVRYALVVRMSYEVHYVFLKVSSCAGDDLHFILTYHLSEGEAQLSCTHRTCEGDHHFATFCEVSFITFGCVYEGSGVEVAVVLLYEVTDRSAHCIDFYEPQKYN
jgi:hypothetical protein